MIAALVNPVEAQQQVLVYMPGASKPSVIVDLSALDKLGPERTLTELLRPTRVTPIPRPDSTLLPPPATPPRSVLSLPPGLMLKLKPPKSAVARLRPPPPLRPALSSRAPKRAAKAPMAPPANMAAKKPVLRKITPPAMAKPARPNPPMAVMATKPPPQPKAPPKMIAPAAPKIIAPAPSKKLAALPKASVPRRRNVQPPMLKVVPRASVPKVTVPKVVPKIITAPRPVPPKVTSAAKTEIPRRTRIANIPPPPSVKKSGESPSSTTPAPPTKIAPDGTITIGFREKSSDFPPNATAPLDRLVTQMKDDPNIRIRLKGYASAKIDSPSQARRKSLFRALAIRKYLMSKGIRSTRIDIHALGNKSEDRNPNRVDVIIQKS
jgi:outer membrane protein OmpA-like peptidoglycan-associated protein